MNRKTVAIRCLTKAEKGYGNFRRCLYVAESLRKQNYKILFIIDYNKEIIKELKQRKFIYIAKPKTSLSGDAKFILDYAHKNHLTGIIIDMREYGEQISNLLYQHNVKTILLDDAWSKNVYADILFNGTNAKTYQNYKKNNKHSRVFLGTKYWILDNEFKHYKKRASDIHVKKKYQIVVSMGGSDPNNLTSYVVKALQNINNIKITVIIGPLFHHLNKLKKIARHDKKIHFVFSSNKMWKELSKADIAISNGGNTLFELATLGIPTLCIPAFKHEIFYIDEFMKAGFGINLGFKQKNQQKIRDALITILDDKELRKKMCVIANHIMDGNGLTRVTNIMSKFLQ